MHVIDLIVNNSTMHVTILYWNISTGEKSDSSLVTYAGILEPFFFVNRMQACDNTHIIEPSIPLDVHHKMKKL